ncbi:MAG: O-antigen ligase family protein, partial [Myxococcota bacterium]
EHSNTMSMMLNMFVPYLVLLLFTEKGKRKRAFVGLTLMGLCAAIIMTRSRAGWLILGATLGAGYFLIIVRALWTRYAGHKVISPWPSRSTTLVAVILGLLLIAKFTPSILRRIQNAPVSSAHSRHEHNAQCHKLASRSWFGVGMNQYVMAQIKIFNQPEDGVETTVAHHLYWLTAAETGYVGLFLFLLPLMYVAFCFFQSLSLPRADTACALLFGTLTPLIHSLLEPILRQERPMLFWFFMLALGLSALRMARKARAQDTIMPAQLDSFPALPVPAILFPGTPIIPLDSLGLSAYGKGIPPATQHTAKTPIKLFPNAQNKPLWPASLEEQRALRYRHAPLSVSAPPEIAIPADVFEQTVSDTPTPVPASVPELKSAMPSGLPSWAKPKTNPPGIPSWANPRRTLAFHAIQIPPKRIPQAYTIPAPQRIQARRPIHLYRYLYRELPFARF